MEAHSTVFMIDDAQAALRSEQRLLESDGLKVETYRTASEFLDQYDPDRSGCLILDVHIRGMSGLVLQERLVARGRCLPIIFVTDCHDVPTCVRAMKLGAHDFLLKPVNAQELVSLVHKAIEQDVQRCLLERQRRETRSRVNRLTPREREVMSGLMNGKTAKGIATELGITQKTALRHRARVLQKLGVKSETELVRRFFRLFAGFVDLVI